MGDYAGYAEQRMREQSGEFTLNGYVSYHGAMSIDELIMEDPSSQSMKMGGMSM